MRQLPRCRRPPVWGSTAVGSLHGDDVWRELVRHAFLPAALPAATTAQAAWVNRTRQLAQMTNQLDRTIMRAAAHMDWDFDRDFAIALANHKLDFPALAGKDTFATPNIERFALQPLARAWAGRNITPRLAASQAPAASDRHIVALRVNR